MWYALDYVDAELEECELVYADQLYNTKEEAEAARAVMPVPQMFEVNTYGIKDLCEIFSTDEEHLWINPFKLTVKVLC